MKTKPGILVRLVVLCGVFTTTVVLGQATLVWTGFGDGTNLTTAVNWNPAQTPVPANSDTLEWNGLTTVPLNLTIVGGALTGSSGGNWGLNIHLTSNQTNAVQIGPQPHANSGTVRFNGFTLESGAAPFTLGDTNQQYFVDTIWGGDSGQTHNFVNNSTNPAIFFPDVQLRMGGGGLHTFIFDGTGDWDVRHYLNPYGGSGITLSKSGSGTMYWTGTNIPALLLGYALNGPITLNGGRLVLQTSDLFSSQNVVDNSGNPTVLEYRATAPGQMNISGAISGPIALVVDAGTLKLSGANTYTGSINLNGGELIVNTAENAGVSGPLGVGGTISFTGGALGFSVNNTFDYSSRFSTASNQAYSIDTGGQNVTFGNGLTSSGGSLAKSGSGTLRLANTSSYSGLTTMSGGKLVFKAPKTGSGNISLADGAVLGVYANGFQVAPGTLTLGTTSGCTLEFNYVNSTTTALLAATNLSAAGTITINVNSGTFNVGQSYPLLTWTSGSAPMVSLGVLNGYTGNLSFIGNTLLLNITARIPPTLTVNQAGNSLQFSWTNSLGNFKLQSQTNNLNVGLSTNWLDYPGGDTSPLIVPLDAVPDTVFFRLVSTP